jgi:hypothetical protein
LRSTFDRDFIDRIVLPGDQLGPHRILPQGMDQGPDRSFCCAAIVREP